MEEKIYKCSDCGSKYKESELEVSAKPHLVCPECGYNFLVKKVEIPAEVKEKVKILAKPKKNSSPKG